MPTIRIPKKVTTVARQIADLIISVDTDKRHILLKSVEAELGKQTQYFTAKCISMARLMYENHEDAPR